MKKCENVKCSNDAVDGRLGPTSSDGRALVYFCVACCAAYDVGRAFREQIMPKIVEHPDGNVDIIFASLGAGVAHRPTMTLVKRDVIEAECETCGRAHVKGVWWPRHTFVKITAA